MTKRMLVMIGCVLLLTAALAFGYYVHIKKLKASVPRAGVQTVSATEVKALEWQPQLTAVGTVMPVRGVDVTTEIAGLVRTINFKSGQDVKAGRLLVQLNADADLAQLQSLQAAADLSARVLARDRQQLDAQAISQAQVDNDEADLKSKRALLAQAAAQVAKKTIRAPFSGRLGITTVNPGQYLNPGDKIVTLQTIDPIYVDFYLPQQNLGALKVGQVVNISTEGFDGVPFPGRISAINAKVDTTTRNVQIEATLPNPKAQLLPGMFVNVNIHVGEKKRYLTLPQTAITYNPYGSTVLVLKPATAGSAPAGGAPPALAASGPGHLVAQQVFVTTGETRGDQVAILKGLQEGQTIRRSTATRPGSQWLCTFRVASTLCWALIEMNRFRTTTCESHE